MSDAVDLCSDGDTPVAGAFKAPSNGVAAAVCITLLSSDDDTPLKPAPPGPALHANHSAPITPPEASGREQPAQKASVVVKEAGARGPQCSEPLASQGVGRAGRPRRTTLKRAYADDFVMDYGSSQSTLNDASPKRQKQEDSWADGSGVTPDSKRPEAAINGDSSTIPKANKKGRAKMTAAERAAKAADKLAEKERKKAEKQAEREEAKRKKEADKAEARAQKEVQKLQKKRETGKTAIQDIVLHLDPDLARHKAGRTIMQRLEDTYGDAVGAGPEVDLCQRLPMWPHRCATWSAKVYSAAEGSSQGEPSLRSIPYTLLHFTAEEFVGCVAKDELESVVGQAASACPGHTLALLVEGLDHYLTLRQRREFQVDIPGGGFNRAFVDNFLGGMVCRWPGVLYSPVHDVAQAGEYICGLTRALAEQPYRSEEAYVNSFGAGKPDSQHCNELLRSAPLQHRDRDVWFKCLLAVPKLGPKAAHAVAGAYASMGALIAAYQSFHGSEKQKAEMLQNLPCHGGSRVGPAGSRELYRVLVSDDPNLCC